MAEVEFDLYSCGDPELSTAERRGCGYVARVLTDANVTTRECPLCGVRRWVYLGREAQGLAVVMPGAQAQG